MTPSRGAQTTYKAFMGVCCSACESDRSATCVQWGVVLEAALCPPLNFTWDTVAGVYNEIMNRYCSLIFPHAHGTRGVLSRVINLSPDLLSDPKIGTRLFVCFLSVHFSSWWFWPVAIWEQGRFKVRIFYALQSGQFYSDGGNKHASVSSATFLEGSQWNKPYYILICVLMNSHGGGRWAGKGRDKITFCHQVFHESSRGQGDVMSVKENGHIVCPLGTDGDWIFAGKIPLMAEFTHRL